MMGLFTFFVCFYPQFINAQREEKKGKSFEQWVGILKYEGGWYNNQIVNVKCPWWQFVVAN